MGPEYHGLQGKVQESCDHYCSNIAEPGKVPLSNSGTPAMNYLGLKDKDTQFSNSVQYKRKAPGTPWFTYDTGDE